MIFCRIYGLVLERSDASFQQCIMPHDTTAENCNTRSNTAETADFSSNWKSAKTAVFPSRWKSGPYRQQNGGGIVVIPPPRSLRRAYAVSCRETKNPNPLPTANRFGFFDFGTAEGIRTPDLLVRRRNQGLLSLFVSLSNNSICCVQALLFVHYDTGYSFIFAVPFCSVM